MAQTVTRWHYHAKLVCGHPARFEIDRNLFIEGFTTDPEADIAIRMICQVCGVKGLTTELAVTTTKDACLRCNPRNL